MRAFTCSLIVAALALASSVAHAAGVPSPPNWTCPEFIVLAGTNGNVPDARAAFIVVVRDFANNPIPDSRVIVDFSFAPDMHLADFAGPGVTVNCVTHTAGAITDAHGVAEFILCGGSSGPPLTFGPAVRLYADGVQMCIVQAVTPDLNGSGGVGAADLSIFLSDYASGLPASRSDYDNSGFLGSSDLSAWLRWYLGGGSVVSATPVCP